MSEKKWLVYIHTVPKEISGYDHDKYYVGITCQKPIERWGKYGTGYREQIFYKAIEKYGWENIKHDILYTNLNHEEACQKEIELISSYKSNERKYGYNITSGGGGANGVTFLENRIDLSGQRFGRLEVLYPINDGTDWTNIRYMCKCDCGNYKDILGKCLRQGTTHSCGCLLQETRIKSTPNEINIYDDYIGILMDGAEVLVDLDDYEKYSIYRWHVRGKEKHIETEFTRNGKRIRYYLINFILGFDGTPNKNIKVNYLNGNIYDFRKNNIKIVYPKYVNKDDFDDLIRSKIKYLTWLPKYRRWRVYIRKLNTTKSFCTYEEARLFMKNNASLFNLKENLEDELETSSEEEE